MRVLLDEMVSKKLASQLSEYEVTTVQRQGWAGLTNGHLLDAIDTLFDVFITMDKGIRHQQRLAGRAFGVVEVRARSNDIDDILPLVPQILDTMRAIKPSDIVTIGVLEAQEDIAPNSTDVV